MTYEEAINNIEMHIAEMMVSLQDTDEHLEAEQIAIESLEKQIPKKPPDHDRTICPSCNSKAKYGNPYEYFCPHCGQAIDWSDDE